MATKALKTLVLPVLDRVGFVYDLAGGGTTVMFAIRNPRCISHWAVADDPAQHLLAIAAWNILWLQPESPSVLGWLNRVNSECVGKFTLLNGGQLNYCLELPYTPDTSHRAVTHSLALAITTVLAQVFFTQEEWGMTRFVGDQNGYVSVENDQGGTDPLGFPSRPAGELMKDFQRDIIQAVAESMERQQAKAKYGDPGAGIIKVRREGLLQRENPEDRKRANALKANHDRKVISAVNIKELAGFIVSGEQCVLDVAERLRKVTAGVSEDLQPLAITLTSAGLQVLSELYIESVKQNAERSLQETDQATLPGQEQ